MTQPTRKACLTTIPTELRAKILQYVLPEYTPTTAWDQCASDWKSYRITASKTKDGEWTKATPARNHHSILLVKKELTAEAKRLMHCQSFQTSIKEGSGTSDWIVADLQSERRGIDVNAAWLLAYPGLDLSQVRDFTVRIVPSDWPYFWARVHSASNKLCETRLLSDSPLKKFRIVLTDIVSSLGWAMLVDWIYSDSRLLPVAGALEDYEKTLDIFCTIAALALECEVHLPLWAEHQPEIGRLLEKWQGKLGARVFFDADAPATLEIPYSSGELDDDNDSAQLDSFY